MTSNLKNLDAQRTRRNIVKAAPIFMRLLSLVSLATTRNALAQKTKTKTKA